MQAIWYCRRPITGPILQHSLTDGDTALVALRGQEIIVSAIYGTYKLAMLHAIYVLPGEAGKGIGQRLYRHAERGMQQQGFGQCFLEVLSGNEKAIRIKAGG